MPKFAAQAIRKVSDMAWKSTFSMTISDGSVPQPAGPEKDIGMISGLFCKHAVDPAWDSDTSVQQYQKFIGNYLPSADISDGQIAAPLPGTHRSTASRRRRCLSRRMQQKMRP